MDWFASVDAYCERLGPHFWAEPVNALTNLAFLVGALWIWPRSFGLGRGLAAVLAAIGVGSFLFHSFAQNWAALADVLPILGFILLYLFAANRDFLGLSLLPSLGATALFIPYAALTVPVFAQIPGLGSSAAYAPVPVLIAAYALLLHRRAPRTARGLALGAGLLALSLTARSLDGPLCSRVPMGTHFMWHCLNAAMLTHMIALWTRHVLATGGGPR